MNPAHFFQLKPLLSAIAIAGLLAACSSSPPAPPQVFPPLNYSYLPPILLTVSAVTVQNSYVPSPAAATLIGQDPEAPATAVTAMAQHRLVANGTPGTATFTIENAAIEPVGNNYVGSLSVRLDVVSADGRKTGFTEASVAVTQTAPDSDATQNQIQAVLYGITKQLMDQMNVQLQYQIQRNMGSWISYATNAATPALNSGSITNGGIQAAPLQAPGFQATGAALTPSTTAPNTLTPGQGILGQMPVTPAPTPPVPSSQQ